MDNDRKRMIFDASVWTLAALFASMLVAGEVLAHDRPLAPTNSTYRTECGSCHVAYPPARLPEAWGRAVLDGLEKHFGTNAAVDAPSLAELLAYLAANAGRGGRADVAQPTLRITGTDWFRREHREVPAATWSGAAVKTPANCAACHTGAENGDYRERGIRVPK